jgi:hypothetical protein
MKLKPATVPVLVAVAVLVAAAASSATTMAKPLAVHGGVGHLIAPNDRVEVGYQVDTPGVKAPTGSLYVSNDLHRRFERLPLQLRRPPSTALRAIVPHRLLRGQKLFYYAVVRDPKSGRSATIPAGGARSAATAWILQKPVIVRLGTHRFGRPRAPEAIVARAGPQQVGFENTSEYQFGPQTFLVGRDGSILLHDGLKQRLLRWQAGQPDSVERSVQLPFFAGDNDVALGPAGSIYVTRLLRDPPRLILYRLSATGKVLWQRRLAGDYAGNSGFVLGSNSPIRVAPDGTLYCLVFMGLPGDEWGWMPVATPAGAPLSATAQRRGTHWPFQPVAGGLRLLSETYTPPGAETAPHEARYALIDAQGRLVRAWRVLSRTDLAGTLLTPQLVGGDLVAAVGVTAGTGAAGKSEYVVLRLGRRGPRVQFSLVPRVWGSQLLTDLRVGPDGRLYQLSTSPVTGIVISRYSLGPGALSSRQRGVKVAPGTGSQSEPGRP